jgi:hypothetical protein
VVQTGSPASRALPSSLTSGAESLTSRRSASDQTLVSTNRFNPAIARTCSRSPGPTRARRRAL